MSTPNPLDKTYGGSGPAISSQVFAIAGILTTVYGLAELPPNLNEVACLWLLHPRLGNQSAMAPVAAATVSAWNQRLNEGRGGKSPKGLIAVAFDQRNHGSRLVDQLSNEAWRQGNKRHAMDMYTIYQGTAIDTSHLITHLPSYVFPSSQHTLTTNLVLGVSLGGHSAWHVLLHEPAVSAAAVVIGCPDYTALMRQRAEKSKLKTWTLSQPPGSTFMGSEDFPPALIDAVAMTDPAGLLLHSPRMGIAGAASFADGGVGQDQYRVLRPLFEKHVKGKKMLLLSGGKDKLVPYGCGEPFLKFLKSAVGPGGWFQGMGVEIEDLVFEGAGHEFSPAMAERAVAWVGEVLAGEVGGSGGVREAKI
ncbi:hypothetical protein K402DRAFT_339904 [Aulographum hederae CBS 113979]|uniref:Alpha/beta-hydrolase n=1 Tax=Aulographum hederae CBS 113979 TaxID=1176131 RepID=A0A6G1GPB4_9PEZI|nr:hypothetical protein K402DRAFT_339904 [Aulographum hederae CBS 113979]